MSEIPQEWVESGAEAIEYEPGFAGDNPHHVARTVIEDVLHDIRHAIAEDLRAEARRMREVDQEGSGREHWADAYEAAAHLIDDARYPWRQARGVHSGSGVRAETCARQPLVAMPRRPAQLAAWADA